jgi:predicted RNase H-like HicB family nuclease
MKEYLVIYERAGKNWSAYAPDVPGCIATAPTRAEVEAMFGEALRSHLELMRESGEAIPEPTTDAGRVAVAA